MSNGESKRMKRNWGRGSLGHKTGGKIILNCLGRTGTMAEASRFLAQSERHWEILPNVQQWNIIGQEHSLCISVGVYRCFGALMHLEMALTGSDFFFILFSAWLSCPASAASHLLAWKRQFTSPDFTISFCSYHICAYIKAMNNFSSV